MAGLTVAQALAAAKARGLDALDAQILLARCLRQLRTWLIAHPEAQVGAPQLAEFLAQVARRSRREPLAYLLGEREFYGLNLHVRPGVLIPRPETEVLVDWGLEILGKQLANVDCPQAIDLGTGSGAIGLAIKKACPRTQVIAGDASETALEVARINAARLGLELEFRQGDWWAVAMNRSFHLALCNPPYIAAHDKHLSALLYEPIEALAPGGDGLGALRAVIRGARIHLYPAGWLLVEHGFDQADAVRALMRDNALAEVETRRDFAGHERCTGGRAG